MFQSVHQNKVKNEFRKMNKEKSFRLEVENQDKKHPPINIF